MNNVHQQILDRLLKRFGAYADLVESIDEDLLQQKINVPKHKSLGEHLWCVVGARESYAKALEQGAWDGFSCSLTALTPEDCRRKLAESAALVQASIEDISDWTADRAKLLTDLAEHEVMHEGQIIRHMYALEKSLPASWVWA